MSALSTLPNFLVYLLSAFACILLFITVYIRLTPFPEIKLIRSGNQAAATAFVGALIGYALPLASAIAHSTALYDMLIWALVGLAVQYCAHLATRLMIPSLNQDIHDNNKAMGIISAGLSIVFGMLNAACMVY